MTEMTMFEALAAPFPPEAVSWRVGSSNKKKLQRETGNQNVKATKGQVLAYLNARDVMDRLDEVCGPGGWQCRYSHADRKTICDLGIKIDGEWVWKADGAGESDIEAEKGALSDALKRAAVRWGVGRYLYHIASPWVDLDEREQITDKDRTKLEGLLEKYATEHEWGSPESRATLKALLNTIRNLVRTADDVRLFREQNGGMIAQMRVKARGKVEEELERVSEHHQAQAA